MNYAVIKKFDIANGPGVRVSLFVSGCRHRCRGCFNSEAWDFEYGMPFDAEAENEIIAALSPDCITGFSLLGGEPFEPENAEVLCGFLERLKREVPGKTVWCYTGFLLEQLLSYGGKHGSAVRRMLESTDALVDGKFEETLKSPGLIFRGSANQRILDVKASLKANCVVLLDGCFERRQGSGNIYE